MRFFRYGSILLIALLPMYIVRFSLFGFPSTLLELVFLLFILIYGFEIVREGRLIRLWRETPLKIPIALFLLSGLFSVIVSPDLRSGLGVYRAYFIEPVLLFVMLSDLGRRKVLFISDVLLGLGASAFYLSLLAIVQYYFRADWFAPHEIAVGRVSGVFNSANALALYLEPIICALGVVVLKDFKLSKRSVFFAVTLILAIIAMALSRSMGGFVAFGCLIGVVLALHFVRGWMGKNVFSINSRVFIGYVVALLAITVLLIQVSYGVVGRMTPIQYTGPNTFLIRMIVWTGTANLLSENWVTGAGLGGFKQLYASNYLPVQYTEQLQYPHNIFLNFWSETGWYGLITFVLLCYFTLCQADLRRSQIRIIIYGVFFVFFLHGLVDVPYFKNDLSMEFWIFVSMVFFERGAARGSTIS